MNFNFCNHTLKIQKSTGILIPKVTTHLGMWGFIPSHSPSLLGMYVVFKHVDDVNMHYSPLTLMAFLDTLIRAFGFLQHRLGIVTSCMVAWWLVLKHVAQ